MLAAAMPNLIPSRCPTAWELKITIRDSSSGFRDLEFRVQFTVSVSLSLSLVLSLSIIHIYIYTYYHIYIYIYIDRQSKIMRFEMFQAAMPNLYDVCLAHSILLMSFQCRHASSMHDRTALET